MPKMPGTWLQEPPERPQDGPKKHQEGPKRLTRPGGGQGGPKTAPRRPQVASKTHPRRSRKLPHKSDVTKTPPREPQRPQVAPKRPQRAPKRPPRGPQESRSLPIERPRSPQEPPKRPPRGLQDPTFSFRMAISCERGCTFNASPLACNMSPLGRRRGPALRAESGGRPCACPLCRIPLSLI